MQKDDSIVLSSRIRLARNLTSHVFPHKLSVLDGNSVFTRIANALSSNFGAKVFKFSEMQPADLAVMKDKHIATADAIKNKDFSGVAVWAGEKICVAINEKDHLREQCMLPGLALEEAYKAIDAVDTALDKTLGFAFDPTLGYINSSVSNFGTGLKASVLLFLPALAISGKVWGIEETLNNRGILLCSAYGKDFEGSDGYVFQIANKFEIGKTERQIITEVLDAVQKVAAMEKEERKQMAANPGTRLVDLVYRAHAVLEGAYALSKDEAVQMLSQVKFGAILGLLRFKDERVFDKLLLVCGNGALEKIAGHSLIGDNENIFRADYVSRLVKQNSI